MARLTWPLAIALAWLGTPAAAAPPVRWDGHIAEASARFGIPVSWIRRVIAAESGGRTTIAGRPIRSRVGAMGLMQLMPGTWSEMRAAHRLGSDPDDPRDNILAGTAYLRAMYQRFGYPGLFGAYNAGPRRYADHLTRGTPLPGETVAYVATIVRGRATPEPDRTAARLPVRPAIFVVGSQRASVTTGESELSMSRRVFFPIANAPGSPR